MGSFAQDLLKAADGVTVSSVHLVDNRRQIPAATRARIRRDGLLSACRRMLVLSIASVPTFAVVAVIMLPTADRIGVRIWLIFCAALSAVSATMAAARWRRLSLLNGVELGQAMVWFFGIPMALQWGSVAFVIRPMAEQGALTLALLVLVAATAIFAAAGAAHVGITLSLVGAIVISNFFVLASCFGAYSVPAMLLVYGTAMMLVIGLLAQRELAQRERLVVRSEELLAAVSTERSSLSALNAELQWRATHDMLMGIANRELLQGELEASLARNPLAGTIGLLFLDLDRFKFVNDTLGHQAGDALLVMVGNRIQAAIADEDALVARVGGDELVILMRCLTSDDHLGLVADKLLAKFVDPFTIDGVELSIGSSIGMAVSVAGETADDLYRHADAALYEAKQRGRGRAVLADTALRNRRSARIRTELELRTALNQHEVEAWLQPEVDVVSGEVVAAEALARWRMGDEIAHAGSFIEVAERAGLLEQLMFEMVEQVWDWRRDSHSSLSVGVNISTAHLPALLRAHEADPRGRPFEGLRLEIAETDIIRDFQGTRASLQRARDLGAKVVLDDFGTGFSSLRMLSDLPIDGIKIDRSYVARIEHDLRVRRLVTSLAEFGRSCGIMVVAEGVETASQAEFLMQIGIDRAQGLLFSGAVEPDHFNNLVLHGCGEPQLTGGF
jgi:diguanylate cyclase (GGDEF)-like protein